MPRITGRWHLPLLQILCALSVLLYKNSEQEFAEVAEFHSAAEPQPKTCRQF